MHKTQNRYIRFFYRRETTDGTVRMGVNVYDDAAKWITYVSDFQFSPRDGIVWRKGMGWPQRGLEKT